MVGSILVDFFLELFFIIEYLLFNRGLCTLMTVRVSFDLSCIHKDIGTVHQTTIHAFHKDMVKDLCEQIWCFRIFFFEASRIVLAKGAEMRDRIKGR